MGIRGSLTELTPEALELELRSIKSAEPDGERYSLDKSWGDFHRVFRQMDRPLNLVIAGDILHPESTHTLDEFCDGGHEWYFAYASPKLVHEISKALITVSHDQMRMWYEQRDCGGYDCDFRFFENLRSAYVCAAEHNNALRILIC